MSTSVYSKLYNTEGKIISCINTNSHEAHKMFMYVLHMIHGDDKVISFTDNLFEPSYYSIDGKKIAEVFEDWR